MRSNTQRNCFLIFALVIVTLFQTGVSAAPNTANYTFETNTDGSLTNMAGSINLLQVATGSGASTGDSAVSQIAPIGFDFYFMGSATPARFNEFAVNSDGVMRLGSTDPSINFNGMTAPLGQSNDLPVLAAYAQNLCLSSNGGRVHYIVTGTAPNRVLTVEWRNMYSGGFANPVQCGTPDLTFQIRLYETSGVIEYVYGSMTETGDPGSAQIGFTSANAIGQIGTVDAQDAGNITYNGSTNTAVTNNFPLGNIASLHSTANGSRRVFRFIPPVPNAPLNLTFANVLATSMTLQWADNSIDEKGFAVYASDDGGVNFEFRGLVGENATSANITGLRSNTKYQFRVYAVSEGGLSDPLEGAEATAAATIFSANSGGGNWSNPATWANAAVPTAENDVFIPSGATVVLDSATQNANDIVIDGVLEFSATNATLNAGSVSIEPSGTFRTSNTSNSHTLNVKGNVVNNGTLNFSADSSSGGVNLLFQGSKDASLSGTGSVTDIHTISVNQLGTDGTPRIVELSPANFSVRNSTTSTVGFLGTLTNGTIKISGTFTGTHRTFTGDLSGRRVGFHLNNPNFTVSTNTLLQFISSSLTVSAGNLTLTNVSSNNGILFTTGRTLIEGGTVNIPSVFLTEDYTQTGGTLTTCKAGASFFGCGFSAGGPPYTRFAMSGGAIVLERTGSFSNLTGTRSVTGGTLQLGNATSPSSQTFTIAGLVPNLTLDNSASGQQTFVDPNNNLTVLGTTEIKSGTTLRTGGISTGSSSFSQVGPTFINNGTLRVTQNITNTSPFSFSSSVPQTYSGTGVAGTTATPLSDFGFFNPAGVTIDPAATTIITSRVTLFTGTINNSNKIQIQTTSSLSATIQRGNANAQTQPPGEFDVAPSFVIGSTGLEIFYANAGANIQTGNEIPASRTVRRVLFSCPQGITIAGGDLTIANGSPAGAVLFTSGIVNTGPNTLVLAANTTITRTDGYVDGNLLINFSSTGSKVFHVGTANGYSPVTANVTALGVAPSSLTVRANEVTHPNVPNAASALRRFWSLTESGDLAATLSFVYQQADVPAAVPESSLELRRYTGAGTVFDQIPATLDTATNTITTSSPISDFSDWTLFSSLAPTSANVSVAGRVMSNGRGVAFATVDATDPDGTTRTAVSNHLGYFRIEDVPAGENYVIFVRHKRLQFASRVIFATEDIFDLQFDAESDEK
ncbi:MAG: fibronectin type III domain-containing protein [Acidobacteria bacterium]|nr:fibronectin type III domain-containing protein [Acidobacteriota bacterium]